MTKKRSNRVQNIHNSRKRSYDCLDSAKKAADSINSHQVKPVRVFYDDDGTIRLGEERDDGKQSLHVAVY